MESRNGGGDSLSTPSNDNQNKPIIVPLYHPWIQLIYNFWCILCLYFLGAFCIIIEVSRKLRLGPVKHYDHEQSPDLTGKVAIITGGSRGIGWATGKALLQKGCHVIITSSAKPGNQIESLQQKLITASQSAGGKGKLEVWHLELTSMDSIVDFVKRFTLSGLELNMLITNAGIMYAPFSLTNNGFESHLSVNYLGHCLLIWGLLPILNETGLKSGTLSRIVNVSSATHYARPITLDDLNGLKLYSPYHAYAQSKLAQVIFTFKLNRFLDDKGTAPYECVRVNCLHPGVVKTDLYEHVWWVNRFPKFASLIFRTPEEGAETVLYTALSPELDGVGGKYLEDCAIVKAARPAYDESIQDQLWNKTWSMLRPWLEKLDIDHPIQS
ncbi:polyprenol dehydrogenase-like [Brevipalpus obovatus]|uniref:polyprenol dehydrogenase-like n=1 Tax=Brevipalpus obovatus TaxID=246614 RepID=UPI003D9EBB68